MNKDVYIRRVTVWTISVLVLSFYFLFFFITDSHFHSPWTPW